MTVGTAPRRARVAAFAAAALAAFALLIPSPALAADTPEPPTRGSLTAENAGEVSLEKEGSRVTVQVNPEQADVERVYVFVYPDGAEPVDVGWQEPVEGSFGVDLSLMPAGEVVVAVLDPDGALLGWASTELSADESHAAMPEPEGEAGVVRRIWPSLVGGGVVVVVLVAAAAILLHRKRGNGSKGSEDAEQ